MSENENNKEEDKINEFEKKLTKIEKLCNSIFQTNGITYKRISDIEKKIKILEENKINEEKTKEEKLNNNDILNEKEKSKTESIMKK